MNYRQLVWAEKWQKKIDEIRQDINVLNDTFHLITEATFTVTKKKFLGEKGFVVKINSPVSISAIKKELEEELIKAETFYKVVQEKDFMNCRCSHKSGSSECDRSDCDICNKTYDFFETDIDEILHERASYIFKE